jgi:hypothetical protein
MRIFEYYCTFVIRRADFFLIFFFCFLWKKKEKANVVYFNIIIYGAHETNKKHRIIYFTTKNTKKYPLQYNNMVANNILFWHAVNIFNNRFQYWSSAQINIKITKITVWWKKFECYTDLQIL